MSTDTRTAHPCGCWADHLGVEECPQHRIRKYAGCHRCDSGVPIIREDGPRRHQGITDHPPCTAGEHHSCAWCQAGCVPEAGCCGRPERHHHTFSRETSRKIPHDVCEDRVTPWGGCPCAKGPPGSLEGPLRECPIHGAAADREAKNP